MLQQVMKVAVSSPIESRGKMNNSYTLHVQRERGKVIGVGVHIKIYICLWTKKNLNRSLVNDKHLIGLLVGFID